MQQCDVPKKHKLHNSKSCFYDCCITCLHRINPNQHYEQVPANENRSEQSSLIKVGAETSRNHMFLTQYKLNF